MADIFYDCNLLADDVVARDHMGVPFYDYVLNAFEGTATVAVTVGVRTMLTVLLEALASVLTLATTLNAM